MGKFRAAAPGDIFVLLMPDDNTGATPAWQCALQEQYGGRITAPLHVTLQRFTCSDLKKVEMLQERLQPAIATFLPISVMGSDMTPLYSNFRHNHILKCRLQRNDSLQALTEEVANQLRALALTAHYPSSWSGELVTVLEGIEPPPTDFVIPLSAPTQFFVGTQLLISRVVGPDHYEQLYQLKQTD